MECLMRFLTIFLPLIAAFLFTHTKAYSSDVKHHDEEPVTHTVELPNIMHFQSSHFQEHGKGAQIHLSQLKTSLMQQLTWYTEHPASFTNLARYSDLDVGTTVSLAFMSEHFRSSYLLGDKITATFITEEEVKENSRVIPSIITRQK